jgi:ADP-ribose pyrophosphatase YjhB (NUDIX family)
MQAVRDLALRQTYRVGYRLLRVYALLVRHRGRGVKCLLTHEGEVLLVRHTYGPRRIWHLPGGGVRRAESTLDAASREMQEELGLSGLRWRDLGSVDLRLDGRRVAIGCLRAEVADGTVHRDRAEIADARWFDPADLPAPLGREVLRILALPAARA